MEGESYAKSIELPTEDTFRNLKNATQFAIDIGGSLAKLAYSSTVQRKKPTVSPETCDSKHIYSISEQEEMTSRLHFVKFETKYIESCLDFIQKNLMESSKFTSQRSVKATGGGAFKYKDLITKKLKMQVDKEDEMACLIKGCNFLLKHIPDEVFTYHRHDNPTYKFQGVDHDLFPYLLVNIGSGVSLVKVESENRYERIGGTATGGGTFWGLGSILTGALTFDELLLLAEKGDHRSVDMLVKDIYGGAYETLGLGEDVIASSFGKASRTLHDRPGEAFKEEDLARSLLLSISNDIGQIAVLHAQIHGLKKIYFGGYFIRGHPITMHTLTFAVNYWSKGVMCALFLRHEGYLGAIGAFLKGAEQEGAESYAWGENFVGSSGFDDPSPKKCARQLCNKTTFDSLELDRLDKHLLPCFLLLSAHDYFPDTVDLTQDAESRKYWLQCFADGVEKTKQLAIGSQPHSPDVVERAEAFKAKYLDRLSKLQDIPCAYGSLTVRSLLDTSNQFLAEFSFTDPYSRQKQLENEAALRELPAHLAYLDSLPWEERQLALAMGLLAGNVFDWGAKEVRTILEAGGFGFAQAKLKLQARPWLVDNFDAWCHRLSQSIPYRCVTIFCDNSGADIILGVFPMVQELLSLGSQVIMCANSRPTLNDVTYSELRILASQVAALNFHIKEALDLDRLVIMESGQGSPCLDLRLIDQDLVEAMRTRGTDLVVIEGMGRAIHTNFNARFACDCLKVAVLKNQWLAQRLGGEMFNVIFKFEQGAKQGEQGVKQGAKQGEQGVKQGAKQGEQRVKQGEQGAKQGEQAPKLDMAAASSTADSSS